MATRNGIPKIIHQTWKDENVPEKWRKSPAEWRRLHPPARSARDVIAELQRLFRQLDMGEH